jgi:hypothetical protein
VGFDQPSTDQESQSRAVALTNPWLPDLPEGLEQPGLIFGGYANPMVSDPND